MGLVSKNQRQIIKPRPGEIVVICAWCCKVIGRKPGLGQSGISHGICPKCEQKYFPEESGDGRKDTDKEEF